MIDSNAKLRSIQMPFCTLILPAHLWLAGINHNYVDRYAWLILY
ncbi:hypothetical protein ECDEC6B_1367 [Escherichia coli DEC6B]|nr:hypothetical protein ECDEC6B_1367 [Escherichia coli DEC6B]